MRILKRYSFLLYVLLPVIALIMLRYLPGNHFHPGARKNATPALTGENLVSRDSIEFLGGDILVLTALTGEKADLQPSDLHERREVRRLKKFKGKIVLLSENPSEAAMAWMILAQQGVRDLYIATDIGSGRELKYKFRPDTTGGI
ncbi:MAG: hypothetical protein LC649_01750 [Bacteroidales bacterium]|nr:hypothetical protein [Bacteroidales bacterium]